jgi:hypothetical protein
LIRYCEEPQARLRASSTRYGDEAIQSYDAEAWMLRFARNDARGNAAQVRKGEYKEP